MPLKPSSSASTYIKDGWFSEIEAMWPGQRFSLKVDNLIEVSCYLYIYYARIFHNLLILNFLIYFHQIEW